jgi:hypothetical protein
MKGGVPFQPYANGAVLWFNGTENYDIRQWLAKVSHIGLRKKVFNILGVGTRRIPRDVYTRLSVFALARKLNDVSFK